jgi:fluoride ion exporter CrcB/FEX
MEKKYDRSEIIAEFIVKRFLPLLFLALVLAVFSYIIIILGMQAHEELSLAIARDIYKQGVIFQLDAIPTNSLEGFPWWEYLFPIFGAFLIFVIDKFFFRVNKPYATASAIVAFVLIGFVVATTTFGYYMRDLREAVEYKYSNISVYLTKTDYSYSQEEWYSIIKKNKE